MNITKINMFELEDASEESIQENARQESPQRKQTIKSKLPISWFEADYTKPLRKKPPPKISAQQFKDHYDDVFENVFGDGDKELQFSEEPQKKPRRRPKNESDDDENTPKPPPKKRNPPKPKVNENGEQEPRPKRIRKKPERNDEEVKQPTRQRARPEQAEKAEKAPIEKKSRRKPEKKQQDKLNEMDDMMDPDKIGIDEFITSKTGAIKIMKFDMFEDEPIKEEKKQSSKRGSQKVENASRSRKRVKRESEDEVIPSQTSKVRQVQKKEISPTHSEQLSPKPFIKQISRRKRDPPEMTAEEKASMESKRLASPEQDEVLDCDANTDLINPHLKQCKPNLYLDYDKDFQITQHEGEDRKSAIYTGRLGDKFKEYTYLQLQRKCPNKLNEYISQNY